MSKLAIGIDLGTTYSCVGIWQNNKVDIIANEQGNRTTPSYVGFTATERLIGDAAKNQVSSNPLNTIFDAKRLMGKNFTDESVQSDMSLWPFKVISKDSKPYFQVQHENLTKTFSPEEISAMILTKMKQIASVYLGTDVTDAVVTVPAYFTDAQRQATKDAGVIAGLNILRIINEPTAAALAYGLDKTSNKSINVCIYDFGGGTLDCTILTLTDGIFKVRATGGNAHLGGEDIDNKLVEYCVAEFKRKNGCDMSANPKSIRRLRTACERAKRSLSSTAQTTIEIDSIYDGIDLSVDLSRAKFEGLCMDIFKKALDPVSQVLTDSKLRRDQIDEIVLVGGSTRIPRIKQMLSDLFGGKKLNESVNPDEAVAYGAAIQAAILSGVSDKKLDSLLLVDVTPLSLGIETQGGLMANIIDRNTTIPCKRSKIFTTSSDNQLSVNIQIFEGERKFTKDNACLGTFNLEGIAPAPRCVPQIEVSCCIDENGILTVSAMDKGTSRSQNLTITNNKHRFSPDEIERMIADAKAFEAEDLARKASIDAKNELEIYAHNVRLALSDPKIGPLITQVDRAHIESICASVSDFVTSNPSESADVYNSHRTELEGVWNPIITNIYATKEPEKQAEQTRSKADGRSEEDDNA